MIYYIIIILLFRIEKSKYTNYKYQFIIQFHEILNIVFKY